MCRCKSLSTTNYTDKVGNIAEILFSPFYVLFLGILRWYAIIDWETNICQCKTQNGHPRKDIINNACVSTQEFQVREWSYLTQPWRTLHTNAATSIATIPRAVSNT